MESVAKRKGRLAVIEGLDGSGKTTQMAILKEKLKQNGADFLEVSFPQYDKESSALVRMYLRGDFGGSPSDVGPYAASAFYAVDRYASYKTDWESYYKDGGLIVCARYTTSNAIHQGAKLEKELRPVFFDWLEHHEYNLLGIPKPDLVLYLDLPFEFSAWEIKARGDRRDIHERDIEYLKACHAAAHMAAEYYGWSRIDCLSGGKRRTIEDISEQILWEVLKI